MEVEMSVIRATIKAIEFEIVEDRIIIAWNLASFFIFRNYLSKKRAVFIN